MIVYQETVVCLRTTDPSTHVMCRIMFRVFMGRIKLSFQTDLTSPLAFTPAVFKYCLLTVISQRTTGAVAWPHFQVYVYLCSRTQLWDCHACILLNKCLETKTMLTELNVSIFIGWCLLTCVHTRDVARVCWGPADNRTGCSQWLRVVTYWSAIDKLFIVCCLLLVLAFELCQTEWHHSESMTSNETCLCSDAARWAPRGSKASIAVLHIASIKWSNSFSFIFKPLNPP